MSARDRELARAIIDKSISLTDAKPGDIIAAHSKGLLGALIRFGTRSKWNHNAVLVLKGETPDTTTVIQAEAHGVKYATLDKVCPGGYYAILPCPNNVERVSVILQASQLLRTKYAFVSIFSIAVQLIAKRLHIPLRLVVRDTGTLICSAVAALCLHAGGFLHFTSDLYDTTPADVVVALTTKGNA